MSEHFKRLTEDVIKRFPEDYESVQVGEGVSFEGEITSRDTVNIFGDVSGTCRAQKVYISNTGSFSGTLDVNDLVVAGKLKAEKVEVKDLLMLKSSAVVNGYVSYGRMKIDDGAQIKGDLNPRGGGSI